MNRRSFFKWATAAGSALFLPASVRPTRAWGFVEEDATAVNLMLRDDVNGGRYVVVGQRIDGRGITVDLAQFPQLERFTISVLPSEAAPLELGDVVAVCK